MTTEEVKEAYKLAVAKVEEIEQQARDARIQLNGSFKFKCRLDEQQCSEECHKYRPKMLNCTFCTVTKLN